MITKNLRVYIDKTTQEVHIELGGELLLKGELFLAAQEHYKCSSVYQFTVDIEEVVDETSCS